MMVLIVLVIASLFIAILFLIAFVWSVKSGQYDDSYTPSIRILFDNELTQDKNNTLNQN
ncbi:MAG: cbb3-type cytochrome oxidase assembly protein CcoS [Bacteroidetes bacterium]|nr:cbb3-type cytochrome oxidase assembly protein CcoS [Bacteroidota bacterium]